MPSVSCNASRLAVLATCGSLLLGTLGGCATTQETAARKQAESKRILERHERKHERRQARRKGKAG